MRGVINLSILLMLFSASFALTAEVDVSTATGSGTGTLPSAIQSDNNVYYTVSKNNYIQPTAFNIGSLTGTINSVTLYVRYQIQSGYSGSNSIQYSFNNGVGWNATTITPNQGVDGTGEVQRTYVISNLKSWSLISTLDFYFYNNDGGGPDYVRFDRVWLVVDYTTISCGDASCNGVETYSTCPQDCCDSDCTATSDSTCHSACSGYNGCGFFNSTVSSSCDGLSSGSSVCLGAESLV
ncbi:MAG: hypothetical protein WC307_05945, partial [Candidatus Nanoarchaeia archaeon]